MNYIVALWWLYYFSEVTESNNIFHLYFVTNLIVQKDW